MAERFIALVLKTSEHASVPGVRILYLPQIHILLIKEIIKGSINEQRIKLFMAGVPERNIIQDELISSRCIGWFDYIDTYEKIEEIITPIEIIKIEDEIAEIKIDISYKKTIYKDYNFNSDYGDDPYKKTLK